MDRSGLHFRRGAITGQGGVLAAIPHETDEDLELYALGRLAEDRAAAVEEHLLICATCQTRLDEAEAFAVAMRDALRQKPVPTNEVSWFRLNSWWQPGLAWAGTFAVLLAAAGLYLLHPGTTSVPTLATLQLAAMRGEVRTVAPASETDITLTDIPKATSLRAEVVNSNAATIWKGSLTGPDGNRIRLTKRLDSGAYFVRLYGDSGKLLHEYGFQVLAPR